MNQQLPEMPPLIDFLLNPDKYPAVEVEPKQKSKRGRPRRFEKEPCPECGEKKMRVYKTRTCGSCCNIYCECQSCGVKSRFVDTGNGGHWIRVRDWPVCVSPPPC